VVGQAEKGGRREGGDGRKESIFRALGPR
jgi:hypothetical protein